MPTLHDKSPRFVSPGVASSVIAPTFFGHRGGDTLICFSHLRWKFVFQRPQHLMTRFAQSRQVIVFEEPMSSDRDTTARLDRYEQAGVTVATPMLPEGLAPDQTPQPRCVACLTDCSPSAASRTRSPGTTPP